MPTILCTWELGAGLGHLNRLLPIARRLKEAGHNIVVAVPNLDAARPVVEKNFPEAADSANGAVRIVQGYSWPAPTDPSARQVPTLSLADVLRLFRFHEFDRLMAATERWAALLDSVAPDLILADFNPTLRLASEGRVPAVVLGNGYTVPPAGRPLPPMRPWQTDIPASSRMHEAEILQVANRVRVQRGGPAVDHLADLFSGERTFVCTIPEFDPYAAYRTVPTLVPFNVPSVATGPGVEHRQDAPLFVYLPANHPLLRAVFNAVGKIGVPCRAYISEADPELVARIAPRNVLIHRKPAPLGELLPQVRGIIHHAGLATAYAAVLAGVPQLVLPLNLEHSITARGLTTFGTAVAASALDANAPLDALLNRLLTDRMLWNATAEAARHVAARPVSGAIDTVLDGCLSLLSQEQTC